MSLTFIDLFSGIGGFRLALENNGAQCVFTSEINKFAQKVYRANFTGEVFGDINTIDEQDIPSHDILCAGFPCQAFSTVGQRKGFSDPRGTMFFEVLRVAKYHQPSVIILENVKGLLSHNDGDTFKTIQHSLTELGYAVYWKILDATMFGVPQKRNRIFIVGIKNNVKKQFQFPVGQLTTKRLKDIKERSVDAKFFLSEERNNFIKDKKNKNQCHYGYHLIGDDDFVYTLLTSKYEHNLIIDMTTPIGVFVNPKAKGGDTEKINSQGVRRLTPREYARLQGFPEAFNLPVSNKQAYRLLGNAVVVSVAETIFQQVKEVLSC